MPIKLLHHKSWHVYSRDNIARVARDEAAERDRLDAEDAASRSHASQARLNLLRGQTSSTATALESRTAQETRKKRKRDEMKVLDAQLHGQRADAPSSEYIVKRKSNDKEQHDTFSQLEKPAWYTNGTDGHGSVKSKKKRDVMEALDPLNDVTAFLARKKAVKDKQRMEAGKHQDESTNDYVRDSNDKRRKSHAEVRGAPRHRLDSRARHGHGRHRRHKNDEHG